MNRSIRQNQAISYTLNQSMNNGLPELNYNNINLGRSQIQQRRPTHKYQNSPNNQILTGRDAEELKEEIIKLKKDNYYLKNLNQQICFQIKLDEKEQIEKLITQDASDNLMNQNQNYRLVEKLKQARLLLQEKQIEIDNLKKSTRYMKIQEMENELCVTKLKFEFLNKQFNEVLKTESDVNKFQKLIVQTIQLEEQLRQYNCSHQKQKKKILNLRQELLTFQSLKEKYKKQYEQVQNEFQKFKKDHESEILKKNKYKEIIENLNFQLIEKQTQILQFQHVIENQRMLISQKQHQFKELEDVYQTNQSWLTNKKEIPIMSQELLDDKVNKNNIVITDDEKMILSVKQTSYSQIIVDEQIQDKSQIVQNQMSVDIEGERQKSFQIQSQKQLQQIESVKQKLSKVNFQDVENIGKSLKYQLITEKITLEDINTYLDQKQEITIEELIDKLQTYPFNIQDNKQALLLARYLIEDNSQQFVDFSPLQVNSVCIINSVLKNVIGKYILITEEQYQQIIQSIAQQIWKFRQLIVEQIKIILQKKTNTQISEFCDENEFKIALQNSNIQLDEKQKQCIGQFIFKEYNWNKMLNYKCLIDKFGFQLQLNSPSNVYNQQIQ